MLRLRTIGMAIVLSAVAPAWAATRRAAASHDCLTAFDGVGTDIGSHSVVCTDGDPSCDRDGKVDGRCAFDLRLCVNLHGVPKCRPRRLDRITVRVKDNPRVAGAPQTVLEPPPLEGRSAGAARSRSKRRIRRVIRKIGVSVHARRGKAHDSDKIALRCVPSSEGYCLDTPSGPGRLRLTIADSPAELPVPMEICLTVCDASSNPVCQTEGEPLGVRRFPEPAPPHPAILAGIPVCTVEERTPSFSLSADVASGIVAGTIARRSSLYLAGDARAICPRCIPNPTPTPASPLYVCDSGARAGETCDVAEVVSVEGQQYPVTRSCLPAAPADGSTILPLTTEIRLGTDRSPGCDLADVTDDLMGTTVVPVPPWPESTYPKLASGAAVAVSVCRLPTGNADLDAALGRPDGDECGACV